MDHSHHDRTYKKSRVQQELEQSVSRRLLSSLLLGCLLFCIAIAAVYVFFSISVVWHWQHMFPDG